MYFLAVSCPAYFQFVTRPAQPALSGAEARLELLTVASPPPLALHVLLTVLNSIALHCSDL